MGSRRALHKFFQEILDADNDRLRLAAPVYHEPFMIIFDAPQDLRKLSASRKHRHKPSHSFGGGNGGSLRSSLKCTH